jgi:VCBS repeat-containing protein
MSKVNTRWLGLMFGVLLWAASAGSAHAFTPSAQAQFTLEGCRNDGNPVITLPDANGKFICPDAAYSTGNLGKGWNELDLVPHRLTTTAGTQTGATTDYDVIVAADNKLGTKIGYDVVTVPVKNAAKSHSSCSVSAGAQSIATNVTGGVDDVIYRVLTIHQDKGTTCVFDYVERLALGAAQYSGSSLQSYMFEQDDFSTGKRTVSIPVKNAILPQSIAKNMTASQGSDHAWNVTKSATAANLAFGDVCRKDAPTTLPVAITVTWTKFAAVPGGPITVITNVYATNPAARAITTNVTDKIYSGATLLDTSPTASVSVPANTTSLVLTHTYTAAAGTTNLNDIATATYTDDVTSVPVPGQTTATASANVQNTGLELNASASIADLESMTGAGLTFSVATPTLGGFQPYPGAGDPAYAAGTQTVGPVSWGVTGQGDSGSVTFNKTVYLSGKRITTGTLDDTASLVGINGFAATSGPFSVNVNSSAKVSLAVNKTIPLALKDGERIVVNFTVTPTAGGASTPVTVTFNGPSAIGASADSVALTGLAPASYTVTEGSSTFFATTTSAGVALNLTPVSPQATVNLSATADGVVNNCSGTASFVNTIPTGELPKAKVAKITAPTQTAADDGWAWTFTLSGPAGFVGDTVTANAGQGAVAFLVPLDLEGTYTVTETLKPKWDLSGVIQPDGSSATTVCTFTVDFPAAFGKSFGCTFTNTKRGTVKVIKTLKGGPLSTADKFTFQLRSGATSNADGSIVEELTTNVAPSASTLNFTTLLVPNTTYQMCEATRAGWTTSFNNASDPYFVPGAFQPPGTLIPNPSVDNSWLCVNFTVAPGATKTFNVDNAPPPGGRALTIGYWKTHASCTSSSTNKDPALDDALFASGGILKSSKIVSLVNGGFGLYGQIQSKPATVTPPVPAIKGSTVDCPHAVSLLDKRDFGGVKKASDPLFNMAAQLVAVEVNFAAGAYTCGAVANAVTTAEGLLAKYKFTGFGYTGPLSKADATLANSTATKLDDYNNNRVGVCP